jgi:hypothetical protein
LRIAVSDRSSASHTSVAPVLVARAPVARASRCGYRWYLVCRGVVRGAGAEKQLSPRPHVRSGAQQSPALPLGHPAPDAELDAVVECVGEAFGAHRTSAADRPRFTLPRPGDEESFRVGRSAPRRDTPVPPASHGLFPPGSTRNYSDRGEVTIAAGPTVDEGRVLPDGRSVVEGPPEAGRAGGPHPTPGRARTFDRRGRVSSPGYRGPDRRAARSAHRRPGCWSLRSPGVVRSSGAWPRQAWSRASRAAPILPASPPNVAGTTGGIPRAVGA